MAESAFADPQVKAVLLEIDSSGGEAGGVFDLAQRLRTLAHASNKPLWAIADEAALSAAYALACAADRLWLTRTAEVGSIGVVAVHVDESAADAKAGMTYTFLHAGAHKVDGHPHAPLSEAVATDIQTDIEGLHDQFIALVAGFRRLAPEAIRATEARVYRGEAALAAGLADQIGTPREALAALNQQLATTNLAATRPLSRFSPRFQSTSQEISMTDQPPILPYDDTQVTSNPTPLDEATITAKVEQRLRQQLTELSEVAAQPNASGSPSIRRKPWHAHHARCPTPERAETSRRTRCRRRHRGASPGATHYPTQNRR